MLEQAFVSGEPLRISREVIREYLSVVNRPQTWPIIMTIEAALGDVNRLMGSFEILEDGPWVTGSLIVLCREVPLGGREIRDANFAAAMLVHGERRLTTFNIAYFRRYRSRIELLSIL